MPRHVQMDGTVRGPGLAQGANHAHILAARIEQHMAARRRLRIDDDILARFELLRLGGGGEKPRRKKDR